MTSRSGFRCITAQRYAYASYQDGFWYAGCCLGRLYLAPCLDSGREPFSASLGVCVLFLRLSEVPVLGSISIRFRSCRVRSSIFADAPINALACKWLESIDQCALLGLPAVAFWFWAQGLSGMHYKLMQLYTRFSCHCGLGWSFCNTLYCFLPSAPSPAMVRYTPANPEPKKAGDHRSFASQAHCYHG